MKKISTVLLSTTLLLGPLTFNSQAEASTLKQPDSETSTLIQLVPTIPFESENDEVETYGEKPPASSASVHDISVSAYNYQVGKVGAQVYTDKFIKGKTSMAVTIKDWKVTYFHSGSTDKIDIILKDSSHKEIAKKTVTISNTSGSASFSGLSASTKYYVIFAVPTNGNNYSFNGSIK